MTLYGIIYYVLAIIILVSTLLAITRRLVVHAVVYLIVSFFATGILFYLLGAPFLAVLEVIIYAGAIMVLFLFIVMMIADEPAERVRGIALWQWLPAIMMGLISLVTAGILIFGFPGSKMSLKMGMATPMVFGHFFFKNYWFPVEIASFLLLIALVGALYLGRRGSRSDRQLPEESS